MVLHDILRSIYHNWGYSVRRIQYLRYERKQKYKDWFNNDGDLLPTKRNTYDAKQINKQAHEKKTQKRKQTQNRTYNSSNKNNNKKDEDVIRPKFWQLTRVLPFNMVII